MKTSKPDVTALVSHFKETLKCDLGKASVMMTALTHSSYVNESSIVNENNERLEFLGDSVLGAVVSQWLYQNYSANEGTLSAMKSILVDGKACTKYFDELGLAPFMLVGKGELQADQRAKDAMKADGFEAVIAALFLEQGFEFVRTFFMQHLQKIALQILHDSESEHPKSKLQTKLQRLYQSLPDYELVEEKGPEHQKTFVVAVKINTTTLGVGEGYSKKEAGEQAAIKALEELGADE